MKKNLDSDMKSRRNCVGAGKLANRLFVKERTIRSDVRQKPNFDNWRIRFFGTLTIQANHQTIIWTKNYTLNWKQRTIPPLNLQLR